MKNKSILTVSFIALFAAIVCIGCFLRIPIGSVPIVLQNGLCILTGALLGSYLGGAPTALFLLAGLIGLPVYSGGTSGVAVWAGPTGGFLPGYLIGAIVCGFIAGRPSVEEKKINWKVLIRLIVAVLAGMVVLYIPGIMHFAKWAVGANRVPAEKSALAYTMGACVIPYIPGDLLKSVIAVIVALKVRPLIAQYLYADKVKSDKVEETTEQ